MFKKILVATDLSAASDSVIGCLKELQTVGAKDVLLLHCLGIRHIEVMKHLLAPLVESKLKEQKAVLERQGFKTTVEITAGLPQFDINRIASEKKYSLIVAGTIGQTMTDEIHLGGVASKLIHYATTPVLLVRIKTTYTRDTDRSKVTCQKMFRHVLFPTDFSDNAKFAFKYVRDMVKNGASRVTLLHVQDKVKIEAHLKHKIEEFNHIDRERLERLKTELNKKGPARVEIQLKYGSPISEILAESIKGQATLIVMGSQGRGYIREIFLGSVSHAVARHAPVSVLLIPAPR